jgi:hypothetical protein
VWALWTVVIGQFHSKAVRTRKGKRYSPFAWDKRALSAGKAFVVTATSRVAFCVFPLGMCTYADAAHKCKSPRRRAYISEGRSPISSISVAGGKFARPVRANCALLHRSRLGKSLF